MAVVLAVSRETWFKALFGALVETFAAEPAPVLLWSVVYETPNQASRSIELQTMKVRIFFMPVSAVRVR